MLLSEKLALGAKRGGNKYQNHIEVISYPFPFVDNTRYAKISTTIKEQLTNATNSTSDGHYKSIEDKLFYGYYKSFLMICQYVIPFVLG